MSYTWNPDTGRLIVNEVEYKAVESGRQYGRCPGCAFDTPWGGRCTNPALCNGFLCSQDMPEGWHFTPLSPNDLTSEEYEALCDPDIMGWRECSPCETCKHSVFGCNSNCYGCCQEDHNANWEPRED